MPVDKHVNYIQLQKACAKPGCPICVLVSERSARYMDNLLFEHVSDRGFRAAYRQAGGFCPDHSRELASYRDGLAVAILGRDILEDRIETFRKRKPWRPKARCLVCVERERIEREYLTFLAELDETSGASFAESRELRAAFEASDGLCAPHYAFLLECVKRVPVWLREFHEKRFEELMHRTSTFIELSAYGRQAEFARLPPEDQLVWKELALVLRGTAY
jgi:hypothetical protein